MKTKTTGQVLTQNSKRKCMFRALCRPKWNWIPMGCQSLLLFLLTSVSDAQVPILSESFESGRMDSRITITTRGSFNSAPAIRNRAVLGSPRVFGFGKSSCGLSCFCSYVTFMTIRFPAPENVSHISFTAIEVDGDWGSGGGVYTNINPSSLPSDNCSWPSTLASFGSPTSNTFTVPIKGVVTNIVLLVGDITSTSEICIDNLVVVGAPIATATASVTNGFLTRVTVTSGGSGYTNAPLVRLFGGGGSGAQVVATVSNGVVVAAPVFNPGFGYASAPVVVIAPPHVPNPALSIAPMSFLAFSNLTVGTVYQLQQWEGYFWTNRFASFAATDAVYTQTVARVASTTDYRLAHSPVPRQAFATAVVDNGFVVGANITSGGSGYAAHPAVNIVGCSGSNAVVVAYSSGGVVTNITITNPGSGYQCPPTIEIAPPPAANVPPSVVLPMMRLDSARLVPYDDYRILFTPDLPGPWPPWDGGQFRLTTVSTTYLTNSQILFITDRDGFFRLQYFP